jgi:hypothetical protein
MLTLDFLDDGSPDCPMLRISGSHPAAYQELRSGFESLHDKSAQRIAIDEPPAIAPAGGCRLVAVATTWDQGVVESQKTGSFEWRLTAEMWDNVAGLLEPFCAGEARGFQWLESAGDIPVLVTIDGRW